MRVALTVVVESLSDDLEQFLRFHRSAGVDVVVIGGSASSEALADEVERYERGGFVLRVSGMRQTDLARVAAGQLGVDWVIPTRLDEVWWPRGESLKDVLAVIPPRYGVVQGLVRTFVGAETPGTGGASVFESRTVRTSLLGPDGSGGATIEELLRPVYRAGSNMTLDAKDWTLAGRRVPLRAWYPVEVFRFPKDGLPDRSRIDAGLGDGTFVVDSRLRDALAPGWSAFPVPSIVDDSSYAIECAAVGEVDLERLEQQIRDLDMRIAELEARFWPTVRRGLRRLARRST